MRKNNKIILRILIKIIKLFDAIFPKSVRDFRIKTFRLVRKAIFPEFISPEQMINFSQEGRHVFFGYYDITPFSGDDKMLLAIHTPLIDRTPIVKDEIDVGFYHINNPERGFIRIGKSHIWCWQQGCRLQWYPGKKPSIIYNCMVDGKYGAIIKEIPTGNTIKTIKKPLYSISQDGNWGLSLDFSRLQKLRPGYGYGVLPDKSVGDLKPDYCGIELVDLGTGEARQLFSLKDIAKIEPHKTMDGTEHYFNHLMFNPSGNRFLFLHLWQKDKKRYSRLFTANRDGSNLNLLNNSGFVSHYNWISDNEIILYSYIESKGIYTYATFNDLDGTIKYFGEKLPKKDGHPTLLKEHNILITDTYPDLCFQRDLLSYKTGKDIIRILARFDSPQLFSSGEFKCDLHPRISHNQKIICVDRIIKDRRCITLIPFNSKIK